MMHSKVRTRPHGLKCFLTIECGLLVFCLFISTQAAQTASDIYSHGSISFPEPPVVLKHYTEWIQLDKEEPATIARLYDMCQVSRWWAQLIQQVHAIKPSFKALLYRNLAAIYNYTDEWQIALAENWILKDANGNLVYNTHYPSDYFVDIGNPDYQKWVANKTADTMVSCGYDGVFGDCSLAAWASEYFWGASGVPLNPRTRSPWTDEETRQAVIQLQKEVKKAIGSSILVCNGIYEGHRFWQRYDGYVEILSNSTLDGIMSEGLWYNYDGNWYSETAWLDCVRFVSWVQTNFLSQNSGRVFVPVGKLDGTGGNPFPLPPNCTREQMATYYFASTLLGANNSQNYLCLTATVNFTSEFVQQLFDINIGSAQNNYYVVSGTHVYARDFSNARVLVNPTSNPYVVDLQGSFKTLEGTIVTQITMEAHTGTILVKVK